MEKRGARNDCNTNSVFGTESGKSPSIGEESTSRHSRRCIAILHYGFFTVFLMEC